MISGGAITLAVFLLTTSISTVNPTGSVAFSVHIFEVYPVTQSWMNNPKAAEAIAAINALD